jgi:hypothetical protein
MWYIISIQNQNGSVYGNPIQEELMNNANTISDRIGEPLFLRK